MGHQRGWGNSGQQAAGSQQAEAGRVCRAGGCDPLRHPADLHRPPLRALTAMTRHIRSLRGAAAPHAHLWLQQIQESLNAQLHLVECTAIPGHI